MNVTVNSQILAAELRTVNKIAPSKAPVPILTHVLLVAKDDKLEFHATDLEIGVLTACPAMKIETPGTIALPAARLLAMVEQFPNAEVIIAADSTQATVTCKAYKSRLQMLPANDFPTLPQATGDEHALNALELRRLIGCTRYAISDKAGKYFMQGALLALNGPLAAMVATDGKQLAVATMPREGVDAQMILPMKTLDVLALQTELGNLSLTVGERHLFFGMNGRTIISRTIDGQFPNYRRIVPQDFTAKAIVDRQDLAAALRRVGLVAEESHGIKLSFRPAILDITAATANIGDAAESVFITYEGDPLEIATNWQHLLSALEVGTQPEVTIKLKDRSPLLLEDGAHHLAVILPITT